MGEKDIQQALIQHYFPRGRKVICTNFTGCGLGECDVIMISKAGLVYEYEIKTSIQDYKADFKKNKHKLFSGEYPIREDETWQRGWFFIPNHFYYACPYGLIKPEILPSYAGLVYIGESYPEVVIKAPKLHNYRASDRLYHSLLQNLSAKLIYGCSYMNWKSRG